MYDPHLVYTSCCFFTLTTTTNATNASRTRRPRAESNTTQQLALTASLLREGRRCRCNGYHIIFLNTDSCLFAEKAEGLLPQRDNRSRN